MTGADIVAALLLADAAFAQIVAPGTVKIGRLPESAPLPGLLVRTVSSTDFQPLKGGPIRTTERTSVAVRAADHRQRDLLIRHVRRICAGRTGDIGGGKAVSILTAGLGPHVDGPGNSFEQTQDLRVSFAAAG